MTLHPNLRTLRLLPWLVCSLVLFVLGMAPRSHVVVCRVELGIASAPVERSGHCRCCKRKMECAHPGERQPDAPRPGEERIVAACPQGCCIDLQSDFELGPMPRGDLPHVPDVVAAAPPPAELHVMPIDRAGRGWSHDTGPPRIDARTVLRRSIELHL